MQKLYEKYRAQGFSMVAFNTIAQQNDMIAEWKTKGKYTFPVVVTDDKDFWSNNPYGVRGTPDNFLLRADGKVVFRHGGFSSGAEKAMEAEIRELLGLHPSEEQEPKTESAARNP